MVQPDSMSLPDIDTKPSQKKPRHRHSPAQLAALNELFDKNEHPSLELRSALADRLGMSVPICFSSLSCSTFLTVLTGKPKPSMPGSRIRERPLKNAPREHSPPTYRYPTLCRPSTPPSRTLLVV